MGRKVVFSAILAAGLVQMTPAIAQSQNERQDAGAQPPSVPATASAEKAVEEQPQTSAPPVEARAPEPQPAVTAAAAKAPDAKDPAERDLAAAPPEEPRPGLVDPSVVRRLLGKAEPAAPPVHDEPALAAAQPLPQPVRTAPPESEPAPSSPPVPADVRSAAAAPAEVEGPAPEPVYAEQEPENGDRDVRGRPIYSYEKRAAAEPDPRDRDMRGRPVYSSQDQAAAPAGPESAPVAARDYDDRNVDPRPVYAEDRESRSAYPQDDRADPRYDDRDYGDSRRYAIQDRTLPPAIVRGSAYPLPNPWVQAAREHWRSGGRSSERVVDRGGCDDGRALQLQRRVRREADRGLIDGRVARDLSAEIDDAADLQDSYCASGMNDWRQDRIDRQFAQIEGRLRYEEDRGSER